MPDGNPYARIVEVMRERAGDAAPVRLRLGTVVQPEPLEVAVAGIRLPAEALRLSAGLALESGDSVLALTGDDQTFYLICKVVNAV